MKVSSSRGWTLGAALVVFVVAPRPAMAFDLSGGVSLGGMLAGTVPRLAVSPNAGISWRGDNGYTLTIRDFLHVLPPANNVGIGIYNQTSFTIGYSWDNGSVSAGPSLALYAMPACGAKRCGPVVGVAPGLQAQVGMYFSGPLGVAVSANVDWIGGRSLVLPGGLAAMVVAGPVFRWSSK